MVGLPAFQGVLGEEVQTHRTHHLPRALQTVCNFNILFDNYFLHLCHHPLSKFDTIAWCMQLPKNSETAKKDKKLSFAHWICSFVPSSLTVPAPFFAAKLQQFVLIYLKTLAIYANILENVINLCKYIRKVTNYANIFESITKFMQIYLKTSQIMQIYLNTSEIYANIFENVRHLWTYLKTLTQSLLNRSTLKAIFRASQGFPRNLHLKAKHLNKGLL